MDAGDMTAAMGGFFMGQMFAGQTQVKPALLHFVCVRVDITSDIIGTLTEVIRETFLEVPLETSLFLEFTKKAELYVHRRKEDVGRQPLLAFGLCALTWTKKDYFLTLGIRAENGAPIEMNIALFRHLLVKLDVKKIKYEIW